MTGQNMVRKRKANEFRVWRLAESVKWDCTMGEIAKELNLSRKTVVAICGNKNWSIKLRQDHDHKGGARRDVGVIMDRGGGLD